MIRRKSVHRHTEKSLDNFRSYIQSVAEGGFGPRIAHATTLSEANIPTNALRGCAFGLSKRATLGLVRGGHQYALESTVIDSGILAVHAALVANGDEGEVALTVAAMSIGVRNRNRGQTSKARVYDVRTHSLIGVTIPFSR